jgi:hypothetical protein
VERLMRELGLEGVRRGKAQRTTPSEQAGSRPAIGSLYFLGFTGIWLVLALCFQDGLGYSPRVPARP